jgi:hypothetical protein
MLKISLLIVVVLALSTGCAEARGFHGFAHGNWHSHGIREEGASGFAHGRRYGNDPYTKAAVQEQSKLLGKLKSICRGC